MDTIQTLVHKPALLAVMDVPSAQEEAILNVPPAPLATTCNPLQVTVRILVQMDTIQTLLRISALLVALDVQSVQEVAILNVPAALLVTISNPLQLLV
jgi:hypothetical protein